MSTWIDHGRCGLALLVALTLACGDDGDDDAGNEDGPSLTTSTGGTSNGSNGTASTAGTTASSTTATTSSTSAATSSTGMGGDSTTGAPMGTEVGSCAECSGSELCMEYTEFAGPADGGGPFVTYFCFPFPGACMDAVDCRCAGHLCPDVGGGESDCSAADGILYCSVALP